MPYTYNIFYNTEIQKYTEETLKYLDKNTQTENIFFTRIELVLADLYSLNYILNAFSTKYPAAKYWADLIEELNNKLLSVNGPNYHNFSHGAVILKNIISSLKTVIANETITKGLDPYTTTIAKDHRFLIEYYLIVLRINTYINSINVTLGEIYRMIETYLDNNDYLKTWLYQIPAANVQSVKELKQIVQESLYPNQYLT